VFPKMNLIEHPEPDFDLEAELPAELAALAEQLTADSDFLSQRFPAHAEKQPEVTEPAASSRSRGARWWLRAAAMVMMLTGLGTVINSQYEDPASCTVENQALDISKNATATVATAAVATNSAAAAAPIEITATAPAPFTVIRTPGSSIVRLPPEVNLNPLLMPVATPERAFHSFTSAQQEAILDLDTSARDASVSF
jgi:hypothetical protein